MKILILGSKGNLGPELVGVYNKLNPIAWDKDDLDITDKDAVVSKISELKPDLVFNCAAYNNVDKAEEERDLAEAVNGAAVGYIADACNEVGATLAHFSSNYVFAGDKAEGYNEVDLPNPISVYGKSKFLGEIELEKAEKHYLIRTAWLYGKGGVGKKKSFIEVMLEKAKSNQSIDMVSDEFGNPTYVVDLAQAIRALIQEKKPFGIYHLINEGSASWYDWANEILMIKGVNIKLNQIKSEQLARAAKRPKYGILNNNKFIKLRPWTEALKEYLS